jgi:hypothetical protein
MKEKFIGSETKISANKESKKFNRLKVAALVGFLMLAPSFKGLAAQVENFKVKMKEIQGKILSAEANAQIEAKSKTGKKGKIGDYNVLASKFEGKTIYFFFNKSDQEMKTPLFVISDNIYEEGGEINHVIIGDKGMDGDVDLISRKKYVKPSGRGEEIENHANQAEDFMEYLLVLEEVSGSGSGITDIGSDGKPANITNQEVILKVNQTFLGTLENN